MADERSTPQGVIAQSHAVGHASPPPPAPLSSNSSQQQQAQQQNTPPRGPRTLFLRRSENGFGFTLRHFIVYPPESCCMLPGHERTKIDEPMDTIFVKQVRQSSPAAEAGLRTGDRVVSVDGAPTRGEQYASVVQRIQQAGPWLRLLVVSKEDDILQRYFGETAHNPETNQRVARHRSPERIIQKHRRSMSMIPGPSPRSRQSWICPTTSSAENQSHTNAIHRGSEDDYKESPRCVKQMGKAMTPSSVGTLTSVACGSASNSSNGSTSSASAKTPTAAKMMSQRRQPLVEGGQVSQDVYARSMDERSQQNRRSLPQESLNTGAHQQQAQTTGSECRYDLYDRTRPESIYSRPSSEQIYDRIKDPIYERVKPSLTAFSKSLDQQRYPISRAEPQVPIYRPGRRIVTRRASEGSGTLNDNEEQSYASNEALKIGEPGSRLSVESRRDSSPASKESLSSYGSNSTLTGNECSDDSVIMTRLRKSFEQKEEFLRRPSHPIGWLVPDETAARLSPQAHVIQREFYARPQKLQRQVWPPNEQQQQHHQLQQQAQQQSRSPTRNGHERVKGGKPSNQNVQRVRTDIDSESEYTNFRHIDDRTPFEDPQAVRDRFYSSLYDESGQFLKENHFSYGPARNDSQFRNSVVATSPRSATNNNKAAFVTTLTRIHENVTSANQQQLSNDNGDLRNGTSSLPSSPGPEKKSDKFPLPAQGLQIVSRRAKQFESGRLLSDDDEPTSDRTNLYKSELSRLTSKRSVPNVAVRKREFESKAETQDPRRINANRESKSLDSEIPEIDTTETVQLRARSNSAESWEAINGGFNRRGVRHTWQTESDEQEGKRSSKAKRQDSYLQAVRTQPEHEPRGKDDRGEMGGMRKVVDPSSEFFAAKSTESTLSTPRVTVSPPQPARPNKLPIQNPLRPMDNDELHLPSSDDVLNADDSEIAQEDLLAPSSTGCANGVVLRRQKNAQLSEEERATRRVSYLKATWGERMHVDSDLELSDSEPVVPTLRSAHRRWRPPLFPSDITPLRRIFEDVTQAAHLHRHYHRNSISSGATCEAGTPKDVEPVEREGSLHVKFTVLDGKRSTDRSWKQVWGVLRGPILCFYKDRHSQSPSATNDGEAGQSVDVRCSLVDVADDYTKRKHVLRVANPTAEVLLQTEDAASMALWLRALHKHAAAEKPSDANSSTSKQQAVPQTPGPTTPSGASVQASGQRLSPLPSHKGIRKLTSFRNRSPTGQSPVNKTRKPSQTVDPLPSPKTKTWKGRVAKQLRRMHGQAGSPSSPTAQLPPEGATFKVPLELCPMSSFSEFVPLIVEMCTSIVEARGLEVVGIYRVPGNTAAISQLTESVNKGFENINLQDPRWSDVNVISSLLKSFFRQLPDSLLTADLYPMFIDADKIEDPQRRMATVRKLLRDLPEHHFETLKHLMFHLKRVVEHSEVNKMEAKNLAIVFGPTLVRASGSRDNMVTMVTDMSHQCRIVESLLNNVDWFFCEEDLDDLSRLSVNLSLPADGSEVETTSNTNHNLLLNNIQKVEGMREMVSARDIVSSIISAANRKIQRRRKGQDEQESEDHEDEKAKSKQEAETLATIRASMALNERQCSVSEMVMMHENKATNPAERSDRAILGGSSSANSSSTINGNSSSRTKYATSPQNVQQAQQLQNSNPSLSLDSSRLNSSDNEPGSLDAISTISSASNETKQSNDEVTIRTYAGLSATTQERIRRFEQETKAMLQRDQHRQRREAEKREEERRRIEMEWQLAKREMENDDILDGIVDATVGSPFLSDRLVDRSSNDVDDRQTRSRSTARLTPLSIAVQQQPTARQKAQASSQLSNILGEKMNNGVIKKFKTDKEPSLESVCLAPTRYGSLDSLHEVHGSQSQHPSPSPSQHTRGVPGDISDDAGSCFLHWTQKILTINRKLARHTASPGIWCYISSHLHGPSGTGGATAKTPVPQSQQPQPRTGLTSSSSAATSSSSSPPPPPPPSPSPPQPPTKSSQPSEPELLSGTGTSSKTLNKFLRGSDLLTSLTSTFDRKWKSLVNPTNLLMTSADSVSTSASNERRDENSRSVDRRDATRPAEVYRDPSLHKSPADSARMIRNLNVTTEKIATSRTSETTPDNDIRAGKKVSETATDSSGESSRILDATEKDESPKSNGSLDRSQCTTKERNFELSKLQPEDESLGTSVTSGATTTTVATIVSPVRRDNECQEDTREIAENSIPRKDNTDTSYTNKLEKFESLSQANVESRSRLKRSESLNKRSDSATSKLKRSESLNKHPDRLASPTNGKLKRSESLNKHADRSESPNTKLKRSESLTKTEKTECNISKRRQSVRKESTTKLKRKNGMPERSIKRRHTVGGTKDFDKVHWLDNKLQAETERVIRNDPKPKKSQLRTSSPDLSSNRVNVADTSFLIEVSFRGPSNVVFNVTNARPQSLPDANLASKVFKVPLESHV